MTKAWQFIADCLRTELSEYGELLRLFEEQQRSLFNREAEAVLQYADEIEAQAFRLSESRTRRETAVADFAAGLGESSTASLRSLLPHVEVAARPLLEALIDEVNALLHRVRRTSRHNQTLLARTVEMHQDTLQLLRPQAFTKTYSAGGRIAVASSLPTSTLRATG